MVAGDERDPTADDVDPGVLHDVLLELMAGITERFGDGELTDGDVRTYLKERMRSEGRSDDEIEAVLRELG